MSEREPWRELPPGANGRSGRSDVVGPSAFRALYENCPDGVLFTVPDGAVLAANPAACEILRMSEEEICDRGRLGLADPDDSRWRSLLARRLRTGRVTGVARMETGDGRLIEVEMSSLVFTEPGAGLRTCTIIRDVTERVAMETDLLELTERLRELSMNDALTGLRNRRGLAAFGTQLVQLAEREAELVTVLFIDVDGMKVLNDDLGHHAGDTGLRVVARALSETFRATDVVARVGGDEFVVVSLGHLDRRDAERRIHQHLSAPEVLVSVGRPLDVSLGWASHHPGDAKPLEELIAEADHMMYASRGLTGGTRATPIVLPRGFDLG